MKPADDKTRAKKDFLSTAHKPVGANELPPPHLICFLLEELLGYEDLGRFEKLAWSIPVDLDGHAYLLEHRKSGVGIFTQDNTTDEIDGARGIAGLIGRLSAAQDVTLNGGPSRLSPLHSSTSPTTAPFVRALRVSEGAIRRDGGRG